MVSATGMSSTVPHAYQPQYHEPDHPTSAVATTQITSGITSLIWHNYIFNQQVSSTTTEISRVKSAPIIFSTVPSHRIS